LCLSALTDGIPFTDANSHAHIHGYADCDNYVYTDANSDARAADGYTIACAILDANDNSDAHGDGSTDANPNSPPSFARYGERIAFAAGFPSHRSL
jgi:hypothetical protein